jgi:hypothetical protein
MSLADEDEVDVCLNLLQKFAMNKEADQVFDMLCPLLKCMILSEFFQSKSLSGIDALSACPFLMYDESCLDDASEDDYFFICSSLQIAINWIYEIINGFILDVKDDFLIKHSSSSDTEFSLSYTLSQRITQLFSLKQKLREMKPLAESYFRKFEKNQVVRVYTSTLH